MTKDDWRALIENFLTDESDAETFCEEFLEAWKDAREEKKRVPTPIEELYSTVEGYDPEDDDSESELREEARKAHEELQS
jgi:hypothetical protein